MLIPYLLLQQSLQRLVANRQVGLLSTMFVAIACPTGLLWALWVSAQRAVGVFHAGNRPFASIWHAFVGALPSQGFEVDRHGTVVGQGIAAPSLGVDRVSTAFQVGAAEIRWGTASLFVYIASGACVISCIWTVAQVCRTAREQVVGQVLAIAWSVSLAIFLTRPYGSWFPNDFFEPYFALHLGPRYPLPLTDLRLMQDWNEHCIVNAVHAMGIVASLGVLHGLLADNLSFHRCVSRLQMVSRCLLTVGSALFVTSVFELAALFRMCNASVLARCGIAADVKPAGEFMTAGVLMAGGFLSLLLAVIVACPMVIEVLLVRRLRAIGVATPNPIGGMASRVRKAVAVISPLLASLIAIV